jgi:hypothetical protein
MVVKKKSIKKEDLEQGSSEVEQDRRPPVTQVVEVLEEQDEETHTAIAEPTPVRDSLEESPASDEVQEDETLVSSDELEARAAASPIADEKRRVLMDELFQKKPEQQAPEVMPEISVHKKSSMRPMIMWAIMLVVASLVAGGVILMASGKGISLPSMGMASATPTPTPTTTPEPTPTPDLSKLDRSSLSIQVLNGSGTPGEAGKMKTLLEEKGYTVDNTGNAETYDYESTEIFVKAENEEYLALLEDDLKESYSLGTTGATLEEDVTYDVRIIVGKE